MPGTPIASTSKSFNSFRELWEVVYKYARGICRGAGLPEEAALDIAADAVAAVTEMEFRKAGAGGAAAMLTLSKRYWYTVVVRKFLAYTMRLKREVLAPPESEGDDDARAATREGQTDEHEQPDNRLIAAENPVLQRLHAAGWPDRPIDEERAQAAANELGLSSREALVFIKAIAEDCTHSEISGALGISEANSKQILSRAKRRIRAQAQVQGGSGIESQQVV